MVTLGIPAAWLCNLVLTTKSREGLLQLTIPSARTFDVPQCSLSSLSNQSLRLVLAITEVPTHLLSQSRLLTLFALPT